MTAEEIAIFSEDRVYRYVLRRFVGLGNGSCLFILLNPSWADEIRDDPTVRRCMRYGHDWGRRTITICNLFALRSPYPKTLDTHPDPIGPDNDEHIEREAKMADYVILGWGNRGALKGRGNQVELKFLLSRIRAACFGLTKAGYPLHPLYLPKDAALVTLRQVRRQWSLPRTPTPGMPKVGVKGF